MNKLTKNKERTTKLQLTGGAFTIQRLDDETGRLRWRVNIGFSGQGHYNLLITGSLEDGDMVMDVTPIPMSELNISLRKWVMKATLDLLKLVQKDPSSFLVEELEGNRRRIHMKKPFVFEEMMNQ